MYTNRNVIYSINLEVLENYSIFKVVYDHSVVTIKLLKQR